MKIEEIAKDPEKFIVVLREKITASKKSLNDIFKAFDDNKDGYISSAEFGKALS